MMECKIINKQFAALAFISLFFLNSCYYDNYDELIIDAVACNTSGMTYTNDISTIINSYCRGCHSGSAPAANIPLETYNQVKISAVNGSLLGAIKYQSGYSPMPKNQNALSDCSINQIEAWINQGTKK